MPDAESIVEWYRGTGLRPFLDAIPTEAGRERFAAQFLEGLREAYPKRPDGRVLFPFRRIFAIAVA
jgi:trans-aconitate 2-methyltransferase